MPHHSLLFEFQTDTGEHDLRIIPKCPTSGVWAELYSGTSIHVLLLLESRTAGSGACCLLLNTSQDEHRQILPCHQVMFKPGKHPCSYPRRLHQLTGANGPPSTAIGTPVWPSLMPGLCPLLGTVCNRFRKPQTPA